MAGRDFSKELFGDDATGTGRDLSAELFGGNSADAFAQTAADQSAVQNLLAGIGGGMKSLYLGGKQVLGLDNPGEIDEHKRAMAGLNTTNAGAVGDFVGQAALAVPAALIPGANTMLGSIALGGGLGALQPVGSEESRLGKAMMGAAGGAIGTLAGRAIPAVWNGVKGIVEPFTANGQGNIVGRTLNRFAVDPARVAAASDYVSKVTGVVPTTAEAALDPGISNLQRQFAVGMTDQQLGNNAARMQALRTIGGTDGEIATAKASREGAADALYGKAFQSDAMRLDLAKQANIENPGLRAAIGNIREADLSTPGLRELANRPAFSSAIDEAKKLAANLGEPIGDPLTSVRGLHYIKLALDQALNGKIPNSALAGYGDKALQGIKGSLLTELESDAISPLYGNARKTYADMSKPINSMDVGNEILKRSSTAAEDALGNPTLHNEALSRSVRDGNALAQRVTGFNRATLSDTLDPVAMQTLSDIRQDLARKTAADNLGKANGSPTAQNLASQNLIRQIAGPLGVPSGFAEANIWPTLLRPVNWAMKAQDPNIEALLIRALKDPKLAAELAARKSTQINPSGLLDPVNNYAIPGIALGLLGARQ
jgi:hypothetical protein